MGIISKLLIAVILIMAMLSIASAAGGFGESASLNECKCMMFNITNKIQNWTLINTYNTSVNFTISKANISNGTIVTSVTNGVIPANSSYIVKVQVVSFPTTNESGYIIATTVPSGSNSSGGASVRLATAKAIIIIGVKNSNPTTSINSGTSTISINTTTTTTIPNNNSSSSSSVGTSSSVSATSTVIQTANDTASNGITQLNNSTTTITSSADNTVSNTAKSTVISKALTLPNWEIYVAILIVILVISGVVIYLVLGKP